MNPDRRKFLTQTATVGLGSLAAAKTPALAGEETSPAAPAADPAPDDPAYAIELRRSPYLLQMRPDGVSIRWRTGRSTGTPPVVRYGTDPDLLDRSLLASELPSAGRNTCDWVATLTGLTPRTTYYYQLELASVTLCGGDDAHTFTTPGAIDSQGPVRFWCIGDSGSNRQREISPEAALRGGGSGTPISVRNGARKFNKGKPLTGGVLLLGDNAYPVGSDANYQSAFFQTYADLLRSNPMWPCTGNHDLTGDVYGRNFAVDQQSPNPFAST